MMDPFSSDFNPFPQTNPTSPRRPISIGDLTSVLKTLVEAAFGDVYVVGEISNFVRSKSGHCYLTLKDEEAQLGAVLWRTAAGRAKFEMKNGLSVVCRGRVEVYPPHGKYQLIITEIEPKGIGGLELAFRQLHEKLGREGLFAPERKKPIPTRPRRIAVVTSESGAAVRDFLNILRRRSRRVDVLIVPVRVQGEEASREIAEAVALLNRRFVPASQNQTEIETDADSLDAVVLIRGGGSMEDLWAFNEERTVRAAAASRIPVVTGIGHEIDVTLTDLAADLHALTPSDAAARLVPDDSEIPATLADFSVRLDRAMKRQIADAESRVSRLARSAVLQDPVDRIFGPQRMTLDHLERRLDRNAETFFLKAGHRFEEAAARLEALSPLAVLARGYSLTQTEEGGLVRNAADVSPGETISTRVRRGRIESRVIKIEEDGPFLKGAGRKEDEK